MYAHVIISLIRCWLLIMALLQLNVCVQFGAGRMKCSVMREPFALWWWSHLKTWKPMQVYRKENDHKSYIVLSNFFILFYLINHWYWALFFNLNLLTKIIPKVNCVYLQNTLKWLITMCQSLGAQITTTMPMLRWSWILPKEFQCRYGPTNICLGIRCVFSIITDDH